MDSIKRNHKEEDRDSPESHIKRRKGATDEMGSLARIFVKGFDERIVSKHDLEEIFEVYGEIHSVSIRRDSSAFAFITYKKRADAIRAKIMLDGLSLKGKTLSVTWANQSTVWVGDLPPFVNNTILRESFATYFGPVERAIVVVDPKGVSMGYGYVVFTSKRDAADAMGKCDANPFLFSNSCFCPVRVEPMRQLDDLVGLIDKKSLEEDLNNSKSSNSNSAHKQHHNSHLPQVYVSDQIYYTY